MPCNEGERGFGTSINNALKHSQVASDWITRNLGVWGAINGDVLGAPVSLSCV